MTCFPIEWVCKLQNFKFCSVDVSGGTFPVRIRYLESDPQKYGAFSLCSDVLTGLAQRFQTKRKVFLLVYGYAALCHAGLFSELVCWLIYAQLHYYRTAAYSVVNVFGRT